MSTPGYLLDRLRRTLEKFQCQFFRTKNAFCEHYGLTRFFRGFEFRVSKLPRAKGKMDISWDISKKKTRFYPKTTI